MKSPPLVALRDRLDRLGPWLAPLGLRLLMGWEYFESGREKLRGQNWFVDLQQAFPFPFDQLPATLNWQLATWFELVGAVCLLLGLGTRLAASCLLVLTVVATAAVHWPMHWDGLAELAMGYVITDQGFGNFKLPLLFLAMLLPLAVQGAGPLSLDHLLRRGRGRPPALA
ncbi:DoxX family protein [Stenotrophomonas sp. TWI602]|uniref:HvfX family Cu-binding RiPP maturation protein n=1 Tax=Stenotrophomonas sp. TWI602 TaxID=3136786 RepID=UPI00320B2E9D